MSGTAWAALAAVTAVSGSAWAVRGRSSAVFGASVWRGEGTRKSVALTFDDGPTESTPRILEVLREYRVAATFFQIGDHVAAHAETARSVASEGHEIGNHSQTHPNFALKRPSFIASEFETAQTTIMRTTGQTPRFLRAPYGVRWSGFRQAQRRLNLTGAMWSIIGLDWKLPADAVAARVLSRVRAGDMICLHDGRGTLKDPDITPTVEAVKRIVPDLLEKGYHLETVTQLICPMK